MYRSRFLKVNFKSAQEPIAKSLQLPHVFISNSDPHGNLSNQLQSQARANVDMFT